MACKKESVPFSGTPEQEAALKKVIAELKDTKGALMPIMQQAQDIYGYLPIEVHRADYEALLRVPGVGMVSAKRILTARRAGPLHIDQLPKLGVVMKRAQYFLTASGKIADGLRFTPDSLLRRLIAAEAPVLPQPAMEQLSLFDTAG